ncbi:MAG: GNAT family N-acetyltransferase [Acidihalobacter sp.]|jgi:ribosomal protein S18 acetylase RimI-like enzyme|uniref:GNAT family N-acetyltransferase n=1 Tax=Acidihalobacter sp. TaxID=1872108 RepID=UPI00307F7D68
MRRNGPGFLPYYTLRCPTLGDAERCHAIETAAYEGDEAATLEKISRRIESYPEGFMVLETADGVIGFINSASTDTVRMADEAFKDLLGHDSAGRHNVVLSVVVHPEFQGLGIAAILMHNHILRMCRLGKASIQLMCRERHVGLYGKFGFVYLRESASTHGGLTWHEMALELSKE